MAKERCPTVEGKPSLVSAFSEEEYRKGIAALKNNKVVGIDDILVEQLKNLGPKAHKLFIENKFPKIWRQSKIIAILKPGKDSAIPKNYRPISLMCHTYKLYEKLILNRVSPLLEQHLIKEQAADVINQIAIRLQSSQTQAVCACIYYQSPPPMYRAVLIKYNSRI